MNDRASETKQSGPHVILAQRVIDQIVEGALRYPDLETGEALVGLVVQQSGRREPDIYVLGTIGPGEGAVREWGMFEHGSEWQGDVLHWYHVNWEAFRDLRRSSYGNALAAKWDEPLMHVGDWHKQPGDMIAPSGGDAQTARQMIADGETPVEHVLAPIVTLYPLQEQSGVPPAETSDALPDDVPDVGSPVVVDSPVALAEETPPDDVPVHGETEVTARTSPDTAKTPAETDMDTRIAIMPPVGPQSVVVPQPDQGWIVRIDFWFISKRMRRFVAAIPDIWPDERLPGLPVIGWHLAHPRRFQQEYDLLAEANYAIDVVRWDADGKPPYEICFSVYKPGSERVILLVTPYDYPCEMPAVRIAPLVSVDEGEDVFEKLYETSAPLLMTDLPDWTWDSKRTLIELVWHVEEQLKSKETAS